MEGQSFGGDLGTLVVLCCFRVLLGVDFGVRGFQGPMRGFWGLRSIDRSETVEPLDSEP